MKGSGRRYSNMNMQYVVKAVWRNWVILRRGGGRYINKRKDEIIHGLSPSVKCVASQLRHMSFAKV